MKIISWNINGLRAVLKKGFTDFVEKEKPDIISLQEIKVLPEQIPDFKLDGYQLFWNPAQKKGYSGTAIFSKINPLNSAKGIGIDEYDSEGRLIINEYDGFYLANTYVPNSQRGLARLDFRLKWDKYLRTYLAGLDQKKPVILCGDLNVAHKEIDLANPQINRDNAGFTKQERDNFTELLNSGFIDTFRHFCDQPNRYTWWSNYYGARSRNIGWRIDYFVISNKIISDIETSQIHADVHGSDHCPISLEIKD
jgi:exodeoxyribonuclease-3